ncbi:MAG: hypothetical protein HY815_20465 [Candidatus Riflebacteria bacterium]|nr:hypothetical protein [Candidatus Riflebacteria bacterium]
MRSVSVPALVFATSIFLVGFTLIPSRVYAPAPPETGDGGPVLIACRLPSLTGIDRIAWWAWNPGKKQFYLANPEEGWGEVDANRVVWSSQIEDVPARAWKQLQGIVPIPSLVAVPAGGIVGGTFLADLPAMQPAGEGERSESWKSVQGPAAAHLPLVMRCGWFENPLAARPASLTEYQQLVAGQGLAHSNALPMEVADDRAVTRPPADGPNPRL